MPDIISVGECMIELFAEKPIGEADIFSRSLAGDTLNILVAAQRLGSTTGYITLVGRDPFTDYLLDTWKNESIDTSQVKIVNGFNAVHFVSLTPSGDREFTYYRQGSAPSKIEPKDLDPEYIGDAQILHVSGISQAISNTARATILEAVRIANDRGTCVSYDPNYRHQLWSADEAKQAMVEIFPYVDYFLPSSPVDTETLLGTKDPYEAILIAQQKGVNKIAVTCGSDGAIIGFGEQIFDIPAYPCGEIVDTTGAGDAFNGAFLHGLLTGKTVEDSARLGSVAAGLKIRGRGALTAMPTKTEILTVLDKSFKQQ